MSITVTRKVHFQTWLLGQKQLRKVKAAELPTVRVPRISRIMALVIHFDQLIRESKVKNYVELVRLAYEQGEGHADNEPAAPCSGNSRSTLVPAPNRTRQGLPSGAALATHHGRVRLAKAAADVATPTARGGHEVR